MLFAAALHATWNTAVKKAPDQKREVVLVAIVAGVIPGLALPFLPLPSLISLPWLAGSVALQVLYFRVLGLLYRDGELSFAYPIMRGSGPLFTAMAGTALLGETLSPARWGAIALLCSGILLLGAESWRAGRLDTRVAALALLNGSFIAGYTILDAQGVRLSGAPIGYIAWMFMLEGAVLWVRAPQPGQVLPDMVRRWRTAIPCGACMLASYGIALWVMTRAPVAAVAALRETSVLFTTAFAALVLRERFGIARYAAAALVAAGAVAMKAG